jgi:enoyl-CoA hydratase/carnithine racemase
VDVERAREMGLVNQVVDDVAEAGLSLASEIAANAPLSLAGNKRAISTLRRHAGALPADVERELVELRESCFRSEDFREGVRAFGEKRAPRWQGR